MQVSAPLFGFVTTSIPLSQIFHIMLDSSCSPVSPIISQSTGVGDVLPCRFSTLGSITTTSGSFINSSFTCSVAASWMAPQQVAANSRTTPPIRLRLSIVAILAVLSTSEAAITAVFRSRGGLFPSSPQLLPLLAPTGSVLGSAALAPLIFADSQLARAQPRYAPSLTPLSLRRMWLDVCIVSLASRSSFATLGLLLDGIVLKPPPPSLYCYPAGCCGSQRMFLLLLFAPQPHKWELLCYQICSFSPLWIYVGLPKTHLDPTKLLCPSLFEANFVGLEI